MLFEPERRVYMNCSLVDYLLINRESEIIGLDEWRL